ncbi:MAG: hypothetical protein AABW73_00500 [Nanoarchaeota archaeon]
MASPIIIMIGILLVLWILVKFKEMRHRFLGTILLLLILSLFLSATYVINKENIDLKSGDGLSKFTKYYVFWLGNIFSNAKQITGSVINQDWALNNTNLELPKMGNSTAQ